MKKGDRLTYNGQQWVAMDDALEKDAQRYRWLREPRDEQQPVVTIAKQNSWENWKDVPLWEEELDMAIDREIASQTTQINPGTSDGG